MAQITLGGHPGGVLREPRKGEALEGRREGALGATATISQRPLTYRRL